MFHVLRILTILHTRKWKKVEFFYRSTGTAEKQLSVNMEVFYDWANGWSSYGLWQYNKIWVEVVVETMFTAELSAEKTVFCYKKKEFIK